MTKVFLMITGIFLFTSVYAQLKVGFNPKIIHSNSYFQVESTTSRPFIVTKDSSFVGIGTLNPSNTLTVHSNSVPASFQRFASGAALNSGIEIQRSGSNTLGQHTALGNNEAIGVVRFGASNGNTFGWNVQIQGHTTGAQTTTNSGGFLTFSTTPNNSTTLLERMRIMDNGNVGIGTSNPLGRLVLSGAASNRIFLINNQASAEIIFARGGATTGLAAISGNDNGTFGGGLSFYTKPGGGDDFQTITATETMRLTHNGYLGIGTTSPVSRMVINDVPIINIPSSSVNLMDNSTFRPLARFQTMSGINNNALSIYSTTTAFGLQSHNFSTGASLPFLLQPAGGNVGIGIGGGSSPVARLHLISNDGTRTLYAQNTGGGVGTEPALKVLYNANSSARDIANFESLAGIVMNLRADGLIGILQPNPSHPIHHGTGACLTSSGVWTNASDKRLKSNIIPSNYGLKEVMQLNPVNYTMNADKSKQVGLIAQEVQKIVPEVVSGTEGDLSKGETLGVSYGNLVPVLINAIKELKLEIEELKKSIKNK